MSKELITRHMVSVIHQLRFEQKDENIYMTPTLEPYRESLMKAQSYNPSQVITTLQSPSPPIFQNIEQSQIRRDKKLGEGHFGLVFQGVHLPTGNKVAVKSLRKSRNSVSEIQKELNNLVHIQANCQDYLLCYQGYYETSKNHYIVTQYLENFMSLHEYSYRKMGDLSSFEIHTIWLNAIAGLQLLRRNGFFHSDIKPANMMIHPQTLQVKYIDFGAGCYDQNHCKIVALTYHYYPYEVAHEMIYRRGILNHETKQAGDIFALGITLLKLLCDDQVSTDPQFITHRFSVKPRLNSRPYQYILLFRLMTHEDPNKRIPPKKLLELLHYRDNLEGVTHLFHLLTANPKPQKKQIQQQLQLLNIQTYADLYKLPAHQKIVTPTNFESFIREYKFYSPLRLKIKNAKAEFERQHPQKQKPQESYHPSQPTFADTAPNN